MRSTWIVLCVVASMTACVQRHESPLTPLALPAPVVPDPQLELLGFRVFGKRESETVQVLLQIRNYREFPDALFAKAPHLPPCGHEGEASRSCLQLYGDDGRPLHEARALERAEQLQYAAFAVRRGEPSPRAAYAEIRDRERDVGYRSPIVPLLPEVGAAESLSGPPGALLATPVAYRSILGAAETLLGSRLGPPTARYRETWEYLVEDRGEVAVVACFGFESGRVTSAYLTESSSMRLMRCFGGPVAR